MIRYDNPESKFKQKIFEDIHEASQIGIYLNGVLACINSAFDGGVTREDSLHHISGDLVTVLLDDK